MQRFRREPPGELLAATVARRRRSLVMAFVLPGRANEPHVEMIIVTPPRADLGKPGAIRSGLMAQFALDRRVDKNPCDLRLACHCAIHFEVGRVPHRRVDMQPVGRDDLGCGHFVPLGGCKAAVWHWRQPDIGIEPDLVRAVAGQHRPAARLGDVADQETRPPRLGRHFRRQPFDKLDQDRMPPGAVARGTHDLPIRSVGRQVDRPFETAALVGADRLGPPRRRRRLQAKDALRRVGRQMRQQRRAVRRLLGHRVLRQGNTADRAKGDQRSADHRRPSETRRAIRHVSDAPVRPVLSGCDQASPEHFRHAAIIAEPHRLHEDAPSEMALIIRARPSESLEANNYKLSFGQEHGVCRSTPSVRASGDLIGAITALNI